MAYSMNKKKIEYRKQKLKVKAMVRVAIEKHELEVTEEIRNSDNKGKMLWKNIEKLKGNENKNKEIEIYDKDKQKIEEKKEEGLISIYWKGIQNKEINKIINSWDEQLKIEKLSSFELEESEAIRKKSMMEHMDMIGEQKELSYH
ncbi:unnamed protein product [Meganyctiphanes norvegica]|uniref:Uncharacterized protein n=1 Tax=Meganyctiphanes norvegica TaxID=48144 RepID=A0AAV2SC12_MEGNR